MSKRLRSIQRQWMHCDMTSLIVFLVLVSIPPLKFHFSYALSNPQQFLTWKSFNFELEWTRLRIPNSFFRTIRFHSLSSVKTFEITRNARPVKPFSFPNRIQPIGRLKWILLVIFCWVSHLPECVFWHFDVSMANESLWCHTWATINELDDLSDIPQIWGLDFSAMMNRIRSLSYKYTLENITS